MQNNDWRIYGRKFILFRVVIKTSQLLHGNCTRIDKIKNQGNECPIYVVSRKMYMLNKLTWKLEHWLNKFVICMNTTKKATYSSGFFLVEAPRIFYSFNTNYQDLGKGEVIMGDPSSPLIYRESLYVLITTLTGKNYVSKKPRTQRNKISVLKEFSISNSIQEAKARVRVQQDEISNF